MALVEIDALVAQALGLTLDERSSTACSSRSCRATSATPGTTSTAASSSPNKGPGGRGLEPQRAPKSTPRTRIVTPDGQTREGQFGWDDLWAYANPGLATAKNVIQRGGTLKVPDGTVITQWVMDDTCPVVA